MIGSSSLPAFGGLLFFARRAALELFVPQASAARVPKSGPAHATERCGVAKLPRESSVPYEAWIAADPFRGGFRLLITGPHGFERTVGVFAATDDGRLDPFSAMSGHTFNVENGDRHTASL